MAPTSIKRPPRPAAKRSKEAVLRPLRIAAYERGGLRDALVEEGRRLFEENGASELSLRELARRLGVSEAAPARHFKGKEELLAAIAVSGFKELAEQRQEIAEQNHHDSRGKARAMMLSYVRYAQTHAGLFDLMTGPRLLREFVRGDVEETSNVSYRYFSDSIFEFALASGWPREKLHYLSHAAWAAEHGVAALLLSGRVPRTDSGIEPQPMIEFSIDMLLAAIASGPDHFERERGQAAGPQSSTSPLG